MDVAVQQIGRTKAWLTSLVWKEKVIESIDALLDNGFIQFAGMLPSSRSRQRVYRVVHPKCLIQWGYNADASELPSETAKRLSRPSKDNRILIFR